MTSAHAHPGVLSHRLPKVKVGVLRDVAIKIAYYSLTAAVFVFVSIVMVGVHP
jgi:hypothetical protein